MRCDSVVRKEKAADQGGQIGAPWFGKIESATATLEAHAADPSPDNRAGSGDGSCSEEIGIPSRTFLSRTIH